MRAAIRVAFGYAVLAGLYMVFTHLLISDWARDDMERLHSWQAVKGPIFLVVGTGLVFLLVFRFAHQRKRAIQRLEDSLKSYQQLFEYSAFPAWVYGADSLRIFAVNQAALNEYGYSRDEFLRLTASSLHPVEELEKFKIFATRMSSFPSSSQWRHVRRDGSPLDAEITVTSITFGGEDARLAIVQNISSRRLAERVLGDAIAQHTAPAGVLPALPPITIKETELFLQRLVDTYLVAAIRSGIKLNLDLDSSVPPRIALEGDWLANLLKILTGHAVKFARSREVALKVRLSLGASRLEFIVREESGGLPERTFSKPGDVSPSSYPGADLLAAGQLCELIGATLQAEARSQHFTVHLPGKVVEGVFQPTGKPVKLPVAAIPVA